MSWALGRVPIAPFLTTTHTLVLLKQSNIPLKATLLSISSVQLAAEASQALSQLSMLAPTTITSSSSSSRVDVASLGLTLSQWGYRVTLRKVLAAQTYWTKSLDNCFLVVVHFSEGSAPVEYVVDPNFKELFRTGLMGDTYK